ncbi:beta-glucuronosyltransferase GlcAT14B-like isoform X2 [Rhodamnia argentea]|uniref:Beta-glucuronosyltransferase GlcAT14B-like isoform X2 n=1 Tax=Rhodamnia argentea TaxID=178133 RepID=A0ABM3HC95_9MYRT|nr:beta-glucuronosyltransferase GlcAT14B-like isoform X2 [Rhodamnia argentea]
MDAATKPHKKKKWFLLLVSALALSTLLVFFAVFTSSAASYPSRFFHRAHVERELPVFVETKLKVSATLDDPIPRLAYLISGSMGDGESLKRTLRALYHPRNQYVVHLDLEASVEERLDLARFVRSEPLFAKLGNVRMSVRANLVTYRGPTMVSNTLHAAAILLREAGEWDWFINLSASDYPLVTQDDLLSTLLTMPRNYNFIEHTSDIGWKEYQRARPVMIDPGLYSVQKSDVFWVSEKRKVPSAYRLFTGSAWMMLSRPFVEYCLWGWDNLPRIVLIPPKQHPHFLTLSDFQRMVDSNAPFARKFGRNEPVLDKIDSELLGRSANGFSQGAWFNSEGSVNRTYADHVTPNITELRPGPGVERLRKLITGLLSGDNFHANHCT